MQLRRVILFTPDVERLVRFYTQVLDLVETHREDGFVCIDVGGCDLAIHKGKSAPGTTKLAFGVDDVAIFREELVAKGAPMGPVKVFGDLHLCDGHDPDGNPFQLSNRP
jgi:catechol 2,3-dioxygenase-like lactoylglutathione lyase family enzyme